MRLSLVATLLSAGIDCASSTVKVFPKDSTAMPLRMTSTKNEG